MPLVSPAAQPMLLRRLKLLMESLVLTRRSLLEVAAAALSSKPSPLKGLTPRPSLMPPRPVLALMGRAGGPTTPLLLQTVAAMLI